MDRLKLLEIALLKKDRFGTLTLRGIDSLEHLRICKLCGEAKCMVMICLSFLDVVQTYGPDNALPLNRLVSVECCCDSLHPPQFQPIAPLGNFSSLRSFAFPYCYKDVTALLTTFSSIPPLLTRLSISECAEDGDHLTDAALRGIVIAMGTVAGVTTHKRSTRYE